MISSSMWEELNKFYLMVRSAKTAGDIMESAYDFFKQVKLSSHLLEGITVATMSHGEAWHFARMGRLIERADKTSRILDVKYYVLLPSISAVGTPLDTVQWSALLESASALEMYRKRFGRIKPVNVADFLILDREFPRAIHFCLLKAEESLLSITGGQRGRFGTLAEKRLGRLRSELDYAQIGEVIDQGLHEFIDSFQIQLNQVGDAIHETFFALRPVARGQAAVQQMRWHGFGRSPPLPGRPTARLPERPSELSRAGDSGYAWVGAFMNRARMAQATTDTTGFFDDYRPLAGVYDEMVDAQGAMRPAWRELANLLGALGTGELDRRWEQARRVIHENGVTYNVHGDPQGRDRRWELDALPWVMDPAEWSTLSAGLAQRAALLNAILADVYGPQRLLRERIVPPELVLGQSGFLRPAHGWSVPHHRYLHLYASHLVALARRPLVRGGRPGRNAGGSRLCGGKPDRHFADDSARVSSLPHPAAGRVLPHLARVDARVGGAKSR